MSNSFNTEYSKIGFLTKPKGLKGSLRVSFEEFFIDYLEEHSPEHMFVSIRGQYVPFFIEAIENLNTNKTSIKFEEVDSIKDANTLQNSSLYFKEELLRSYIEEEEEDWAFLVGYTLVDDRHQTIGKIEGIVYLPEHELLQINHQEKELLIPIHEDMVIIVDDEAKIIQMELPDGLLEL